MRRILFRPVLLALAAGVLLLPGCLASQTALAEPSPTPVFDPAEFFVGRSSGLGTLSIRTQGTDTVRVESTGTRLDDGSVRLIQTVRRGDAEPYERTWVLRPVSPTEWTGTLTEADGPVEVTIDGNELRIGYRTGTFTTISQRLLLQPGGDVALNRLTAKVLGIPVARLSERIKKAR